MQPRKTARRIERSCSVADCSQRAVMATRMGIFAGTAAATCAVHKFGPLFCAQHAERLALDLAAKSQTFSVRVL